jgi:hypothetical protein
MKPLARLRRLVYLFMDNPNRHMKRLTLLLTGVIGLTLNSFAAESPRGTLLELHSCEVYAGPCMVNSEAVQEGRYMVRVWDFTGGSHQGTDLAGLRVAVLQCSPDNLAAADSQSGDAVVYLPDTTTPAARDALLAWVKTSQKDFQPTRIQTRVAPLHLTKSVQGYEFSAGDFVSMKTTALDSCPMGGCGEMLWYQPRSATSVFTVAVTQSTQVNEPLLKLKWNSGNNRSLFLARFGGEETAKNMYVSLAELCGPTKAVF